MQADWIVDTTKYPYLTLCPNFLDDSHYVFTSCLKNITNYIFNEDHCYFLGFKYLFKYLQATLKNELSTAVTDIGLEQLNTWLRLMYMEVSYIKTQRRRKKCIAANCLGYVYVNNTHLAKARKIEYTHIIIILQSNHTFFLLFGGHERLIVCLKPNCSILRVIRFICVRASRANVRWPAAIEYKSTVGHLLTHTQTNKKCLSRGSWHHARIVCYMVAMVTRAKSHSYNCGGEGGRDRERVREWIREAPHGGFLHGINYNSAIWKGIMHGWLV